MDKKLRILAGEIVTESKMNKQSKLQLLNWLQTESTDSQVKAFLLDGKIIKLDEQSEEVVHDRFEASNISEVIGLATAVVGAAAAILSAKKISQVYFSKAAKACAEVRKSKGGKAANLCRHEYKMKGEQGKVASLRRDLAKCSKTTNAEKCQKIIINSIKMIEKKLMKMQKLKGKYMAKRM